MSTSPHARALLAAVSMVGVTALHAAADLPALGIYECTSSGWAEPRTVTVHEDVLVMQKPTSGQGQAYVQASKGSLQRWFFAGWNSPSQLDKYSLHNLDDDDIHAFDVEIGSNPALTIAILRAVHNNGRIESLNIRAVCAATDGAKQRHRFQRGMLPEQELARGHRLGAVYLEAQSTSSEVRAARRRIQFDARKLEQSLTNCSGSGYGQPRYQCLEGRGRQLYDQVLTELRLRMGYDESLLLVLELQAMVRTALGTCAVAYARMANKLAECSYANREAVLFRVANQITALSAEYDRRASRAPGARPY